MASTTRRIRLRNLAFALGLLAAPMFAVPVRAGVTVALQTASASVAPGADFDVYVTVTQAGSAFNAFDAVVGYDPAALTFVQLAPLSLQEGALMTGACGNRFHQFSTGVGRDTITDVLLCNGVSVTGPGQIYRLRFHASSTPQTTTIHLLPGLRFYDAGIAVLPVTASDLTVGIGGSVGVESGVVSAPLRVRVSPNPARGSAALLIESDLPERHEIAILDAMGRTIRHLETAGAAATRRVVWDGRSDAGVTMPAGVYPVLVRSAHRAARTCIVRLESR